MSAEHVMEQRVDFYRVAPEGVKAKLLAILVQDAGVPLKRPLPG